MARVQKTVFISYRRDDEQGALNIYQDLTSRWFDRFDVFIDYRGLGSGKFEAEIFDNIRSRAHFLVLLTRHALDRCSDPNDWLRREIILALEIDTNIVPITYEGFSFDHPQLTGELKRLKDYQALPIPPNYFHEAMKRLRGEKFLRKPIEARLPPASPKAKEVAREDQAAIVNALKEKETKRSEQAAVGHALELENRTQRRLRPDSIIPFFRNPIARCIDWFTSLNWRPIRMVATSIVAIAVVIWASMHYLPILRSRLVREQQVQSESPRGPVAPPANEVSPNPPQISPPTRKDDVSQAQPEVAKNPKDEAEYVHVPAGQFMMGCSSGDQLCFSDERTRHEVSLAAFWIGRTEITQDSFEYVLPGRARSRFTGDRRRPVENLTWADARMYCETVGMRLPTEAEWEYAARAGLDSSVYGSLDDVAWHAGNSGRETHAVSGKRPNAWGLYDMLGNVWEWVSDWYGRYDSNSVDNPAGPTTGVTRVVRGGSCCGGDNRSERVSNRFKLPPTNSINAVVGARCAGANLPQ